MTAYTREPKRALAKCTAADCKWIRIFWEIPDKLPCEVRADLALAQHRRMVHRVKVRINGR